MAIYWVFGAALVFKNPSFRCFRQRALETEFFCKQWCIFKIWGPRGWELVSSPQWGPWSAGWQRSSLHPPARKLRKHSFMCVFWKESSGQWLPHTPWKHLKLWMESLKRCTSDPTNTHTLFFCLLFVFDVAAISCCHQPIFTPGTTAVNTELMYLEGRGAGGINSAWKLCNLASNFTALWLRSVVHIFNQDQSVLEPWQQSGKKHGDRVQGGWLHSFQVFSWHWQFRQLIWRMAEEI